MTPALLTLSSADDVEPLAAEWRSLAARVGASYFQLPDWVVAWWETLAGRPPTTIATWRSGDGSLEAVAATSVVSARLHPRLPFSVKTVANTGSGAGAADHLGFPALPERVGDVARWLGDLRQGSLVLSSLAPSADVLVPEGAVVTAQTPCPRMPIGPDHPIGRSGDYRRQVRSRVKKAVEAGVDFRYLPPGEMGPDTLNTLIALHEARWEAKDGESSFDRSRLPLHSRLIDFAGGHGGPAAVVADGPEGVIGVVYGFVWDSTFAFFQSGWHPDYANLSLGTVIHAKAFELMSQAGVEIYDFLRGAEEYKYRFGAEDVVNTSVLIPRGLSGRILAAKAEAKARHPNKTAARRDVTD